ncbi:heptosyltransferase-3 [Verrucomicrobium sp. GAS474]|uniref:glycosyltransferase family 9 protein n=1 Tax=Verrucomicrobium sp. GAS474 TaxID=1882831 RepID=UPI000879B0E8|nr:glycosyltransferase family 9 protein [Verrucomicrobium sp. GAS474]SDU10525.1 heptosyltransferase-3 [Verrucomicrobium sp. GAS474]
MNPSPPRPPQRLLLVRRRYLGDIVLLDPLLRALRHALPGLQLTLLVDEGYGPIQARHPALDHIVELPRQRPAESVLSYVLRTAATFWKLRRHRFDTAVNISPGFRVRLLLRLARIGRVIGLRTEGDAKAAGKDGLTDPVVRPAAFFQSRGIVDLYLSLLEPLGIAPLDDDACRPCRFFFLDDARDEAAERLRRAFPCSCRPLVLIHPGARLPSRRWPAAAFAEAAARLHAENRADLLLVCGPGEEPLLEEIAALLKKRGLSLPALPALPLELFAALCEKAAVYLGNDTGSMHLAAAALPPTGKIVALFGSQSTTLWAPVGTGHRLLQPPLPCGTACLAPETCRPENDYTTRCIARIGIDEVVAAVLAALPS